MRRRRRRRRRSDYVTFFCFIYDVLVIGRVGEHVIPRSRELFV